jgi:ATP-dependent RNA helicase DDX24/MAK5
MVITANELPELQVEPGFLPKLRERVRIAREIEKAQHAVKKAKHEKSWLQETAEAMDIDLDSDLLSVITSYPLPRVSQHARY